MSDALAPITGRLGLAPKPPWRPYLMGIVNATPDSFSDEPGEKTVADRLALAQQLVADGADLIDVGGESGITNRPPVDAAEEIARVVPVIEAITAAGIPVSIDTYKPAVADAALAAGACMVNDVSGLRDPELATVVAKHNAAMVLMHTRAAPKTKIFPDYDDVTADVCEFLRDAVAEATARGVQRDLIVLDPGPDFSKTPAQTVTTLRELDQLAALGHPLLLAISRKDFVGALTGRGPRDRAAGTLAALEYAAAQDAAFVRLHDVAAATDFLTVRAALSGDLEIDPELSLEEGLRRTA
ncbi:MAG: dihydropteroate synthase [Thermoleophilaceae bacterium]|nr:dihydropteroate synthase [Thermoleophilaceae bacterium]